MSFCWERAYIMASGDPRFAQHAYTLDCLIITIRMLGTTAVIMVIVNRSKAAIVQCLKKTFPQNFSSSIQAKNSAGLLNMMYVNIRLQVSKILIYW